LVYVVYIDFEAFNHISVDVNSGFEHIDSKQLSVLCFMKVIPETCRVH